MSGAEDGSIYFSRLLEYVEGGEVNTVDAFKDGSSNDFILNSLSLTSKVKILKDFHREQTKFGQRIDFQNWKS